jgi:hypothetical protein
MMKISNMKKRFTFLLLFCCFFGFSQISVNELVSLAKKDDIPGDIFDFFNRKGFIYSRKESLNEFSKCYVYFFNDNKTPNTTITIIDCSNTLDLDSSISISIGSHSSKIYDNLLQTIKQRKIPFTKDTIINNDVPITKYVYKISPTQNFSFYKYIKSEGFAYFVNFRYTQKK